MKNLIIAIVTLFVSNTLYSQPGYWEQIIPEEPFPYKVFHSMAENGEDKVLIFSGIADRDNAEDQYNDTWLFDYATKKMTLLDPPNRPYKRENASMCKISKNKVLLFGGWPRDSHFVYGDDTWIFDLEAMNWEKIETTLAPSPRRWAALSYYGEGEVMLFGGDTATGQNSNDTWIFDLNSKNWERIFLKNPNPPIGDMYSLVYINNTMYLYGGERQLSGIDYNDTWILDLDNKKWVKIILDKVPPKLIWRLATKLDDEHIFLFHAAFLENGEYNCPNEPCEGYSWIFNIKENKWTFYDNALGPLARVEHQIVNFGKGRVLLFGGSSVAFPTFNDLWIFHSNITEIEENNNAKSVFIENESQIYLNSDNEVIISITISSLLGQIVFQSNDIKSNFQFNKANLPKGIYFINAVSNSKVYSFKFLNFN